MGRDDLDRVGKRVLDVLISSTALVALAPLLFFCAVAVKLTSKGPVFYRWRIIGIGGKRVVSYKFRTMVEGAERMEIDLRKKGNNEMADVYFKLGGDPRVTGVGRILRKFSIDELPSLYSVLKGDMSIVGPRPVRWHEYGLLKEWHKKRFAVKPGLTSPWVVSGKNAVKNFDDIAKMDLDYIENRTLLYDLKVILKTIPLVVLGKNY